MSTFCSVPVFLRAIAMLLALAPPARAVENELDGPDNRWLHAYVLLQTGNQLAEGEVWTLALANYTAALEQFDSLAADHPDFQPRLVAYRRGDLKERIRLANESMNAGEHDLAMLYEDIIETSRTGAKSCYRLDFESAYKVLVGAQWRMEDLLKRSPAPIVAALAKQKAFIDEIVDTSREELLRLPEGGLKIYHIEKDFAASVSIAMSDLPSYRAPEAAESGMSSALFPDGLVARARGQWYR